MIKVNAIAVWSFVWLAFITCSSATDKESDTTDQEAQTTTKIDSGWSVILKGKVEFVPDNKPYIIVSELMGENEPDTIHIKADRTFEKKINLTEPGYYELNFFSQQVANVILYKSDLNITVQGQANNKIEITGSPEVDFINKANSIIQSIQFSPEAIKLNNEFNEARLQNNQKKMMEVQNAYMNLTFAKQAEVVELIKQQPASLGVINLLQSGTLDKDRFFDVYEDVAEKLRKEWPNYSHAKQFIEMVNQMKATAVGQVAPEISLPDPNGNIVKLSSLRGKYVLVDFWAKWCGPCRAENPNVVKVYNQYKDKGFTVYGVSLDRKKEDWVQAIEADGLTWTHVSDLKFWQSEAAKTYNITAIPFSLLLDPNGVIIAKNLRGAALEAKLKEVLK